MARAVAIWYVENTDGKLIAAFTVKRELADWLDRKYGPAEQRDMQTCPVGVYRIGDGHHYPDAVPKAYNPRTLEPVT